MPFEGSGRKIWLNYMNRINNLKRNNMSAIGSGQQAVGGTTTGGLYYADINVNTPSVEGEIPNSVRREITITPLHYGYDVRVGCQKFAIESPEKLCKHLLAYLKNPAEVEKKFLSGKYKL